MTTITAKQQTAFESLVTTLATQRRIPRPLAIELLVKEIGGGAEKVAA